MAGSNRYIPEFGIRGSETKFRIMDPEEGLISMDEGLSINIAASPNVVGMPRLKQGGIVPQKLTNATISGEIVVYRGLDGGYFAARFEDKLMRSIERFLDITTFTYDEESVVRTGREVIRYNGVLITNWTLVEGNPSNDWQTGTAAFTALGYATLENFKPFIGRPRQ